MLARAASRGVGAATLDRLAVMRLGGLGALLWVVSQQSAPGFQGDRLAVLALMLGAAAGYVLWLIGRRSGDARVTVAGLTGAAVAGGALAAFAPVATAFPAIAALGAAIELDAPSAVPVALAGAGSLVLASGLYGRPATFLLQGVLVALVGLMVGASRRQYVHRARQAERLLAERRRADVERDRAAALAERNRIGREIHDVLAHSLGALSVQLDAADAILGEGSDLDRAREMVNQARRLAVDGLNEARHAVKALRETPLPLPQRLEALAEQSGAALHISGSARAVPPDAEIALYRAAQESIANARKHAPGAAVDVDLGFDRDRIVLTITNEASAAPTGVTDLAATGGGFGLQGMAERIELLGGSVEAGPHGAGFRVRVLVPA